MTRCGTGDFKGLSSGKLNGTGEYWNISLSPRSSSSFQYTSIFAAIAIISEVLGVNSTS